MEFRVREAKKKICTAIKREGGKGPAIKEKYNFLT